MREGIQWFYVPKRPTVVAPEFGAWLRALWRPEGVSYEQVAIRLRPHLEVAGIKLNRTNLQKYEQGRVPNVLLLSAICEAYGVSTEDASARLFASLKVVTQNGDLIDAFRTRQTKPDGHTNEALRETPGNELVSDASAAGRDPIGHRRSVQMGSQQQGEPDVEIPASTRIQQLRAELAIREGILAEARRLAEQIVAATTPRGDEGGGAVSGRPKSRRSR